MTTESFINYVISNSSMFHKISIYGKSKCNCSTTILLEFDNESYIQLVLDESGDCSCWCYGSFPEMYLGGDIFKLEDYEDEESLFDALIECATNVYESIEREIEETLNTLYEYIMKE